MSIIENIHLYLLLCTKYKVSFEESKLESFALNSIFLIKKTLKNPLFSHYLVL